MSISSPKNTRYQLSSVHNIKANLPIVLPWIVISLLYDIVALLPMPGLQKLVASQWGDLLLFGVFLLFVIIFFPPLVRRLWGCKKLPEGYLKNQSGRPFAPATIFPPISIFGRSLKAGR